MATEKVLVAPLHWGLGHATRCIPLVRQQLAKGNEVLIAASGGPAALLKEHFPDLAFLNIPSFHVTYPRNGNMAMHFLKHGFPLLRSIWKEHRVLQKIVEQNGITMVISDSRFGLWTKRAKSVFVTHQLEIQSPVFQSAINWMNRRVMCRYDEVWVPDYEEGPGLAGRLSHPVKKPGQVKFIGPLSRFGHPILRTGKKWKALVMLSGPEPHREMLEKELVRHFMETDGLVLILRGKPERAGEQQMGNIRIVSHLSDAKLLVEMAQAEMIISRSGYSTIMDLHALQMPAFLIPTPGQTEQEYLARLHGHVSEYAGDKYMKASQINLLRG